MALIVVFEPRRQKGANQQRRLLLRDLAGVGGLIDLGAKTAGRSASRWHFAVTQGSTVGACAIRFRK